MVVAGGTVPNRTMLHTPTYPKGARCPNSLPKIRLRSRPFGLELRRIWHVSKVAVLKCIITMEVRRALHKNILDSAISDRHYCDAAGAVAAVQRATSTLVAERVCIIGRYRVVIRARAMPINGRHDTTDVTAADASTYFRRRDGDVDADKHGGRGLR